MHRFSSLLRTCIFITVEAVGIYQIPLSDHYQTIPQRKQHSARNDNPNHQPRYPQEQQHILIPLHGHNASQSRINLRDTALILYSLPITLGTPPQPFSLALSLSPTPLFVPSASCWSVYCKSLRHQDSSSSSNQSTQSPYFQTYNSTLSSTTHPTNLTSTHEFANVLFAGPITFDRLALGPIIIPSQPFISAERIEPQTYFHWYYEYSGVLGLAYPSHSLSSSSPSSSEKDLPTPWKALIDKNLLSKNIFTLVLPSGPRDFSTPRTNGLLTLGDIPTEHAEKKFIYLPLHPHTPKSWTVSVTSLSFGEKGDSRALHQEFTTSGGAKASFETVSPFILLPGNWAPSMKRLIGATEPDGFYWEFPCENRNFLPDLVFEFLVRKDEDASSEFGWDPEDGFMKKEISLSPYEYTFEVTGGNVPDIPPIGCRIGFEDSEDEGKIVLGWPFLQNFVGVFDFDMGRVGLIRLRDK